MKEVFIFGGGAVGMALAVHLINSGQKVRLVRRSGIETVKEEIEVIVEDNGTLHRATVPCIAITQLDKPKGWLVVAAKAFANADIAKALVRAQAKGGVVLLQNGLGVERPFIDAGFPEIYRAVLYVTGQRDSNQRVSFHSVRPSVIGSVNGNRLGLQTCLAVLNSAGFPFEESECIEKVVWKKVVVNCVFNSLCPLLEADNGVFSREVECLALAREIVNECHTVAQRLGVDLDKKSVMDQIMQISSGSTHLISTLQDIRKGRPTEIDFLNLEVARLGAALDPRVPVPRTEMLGRMIALKAKIAVLMS